MKLNKSPLVHWKDVRIEKDRRPSPILQPAGLPGSFLRRKGLCILDGDNSTGKTSLALQLAIHAAATPDGETSAPVAGMEVFGGSALFATFDDPLYDLHERTQGLIETTNIPEDVQQHIGQRLSFLNMRAEKLALFAAPAKGEFSPQPQDGMQLLTEMVKKTEAHLVIIDSLFSAYAGAPASAGAVSKYLAALSEFAEHNDCGVLGVVNATASIARQKDPFAINFVLNLSRTVLLLNTNFTTRAGAYQQNLRIAKSSQSPSHMTVPLTPIRDTVETQGIVGFEADGSWHSNAPTQSKPQSRHPSRRPRRYPAGPRKD